MGWREVFFSALCAAVFGSTQSSSSDRVASRVCFHPLRSDGSVHDFTFPDVLETRNTTYNASGFEILGFPCNQFGQQEPGGSGLEIVNGIKYVRPGNNFEPNFPLFKKIDVNGEKENQLYTFLKRYCLPTRQEFSSQQKLFYTPMSSNDVRWNFEKFLVNRQGKPIMRYDPSTPPNDIAKDIEYVLTQN